MARYIKTIRGHRYKKFVSTSSKQKAKQLGRAIKKEYKAKVIGKDVYVYSKRR